MQQWIVYQYSSAIIPTGPIYRDLKWTDLDGDVPVKLRVPHRWPACASIFYDMAFLRVARAIAGHGQLVRRKMRTYIV